MSLGALFALAFPLAAPFWALPAVTGPSLSGVAALLGSPLGAAAGWAHFITSTQVAATPR